MTAWNGPDGYWVSDEADLLDAALVHEWLSTLSYGAQGRPRQTTEKAIAGSLNLGLYDADGAQAGFCRWVTDGATFAWLCDVFVDPGQRGRGLGVFLIRIATGHPEVQGLRFLLGTKDAHDLYRKFGFDSPVQPERLMEIRPDLVRPVVGPASA
jgi:GNAT superfamily N-acetyltransferase